MIASNLNVNDALPENIDMIRTILKLIKQEGFIGLISLIALPKVVF